MRRPDVNDMETKVAVKNEETVENSVFKKGSVQKCPLVFGRKGEDPWRPEQAGVAEEPERRVWAREIEDDDDMAVETRPNAVVLDKVVVDKQEKLKNQIMKLKEKLV